MADGRETATGGTAGDGGETPLQVLDAGRLGTELGERATLVQFSTAFCQPCRATRRVLDDVAALVPGVRHVEIDAEAHLDLVRAVGVERTPTVLILD
ncbi:thioredoxin family protein, partial [Streptomyces albidoflavus]